MGKIKIVFSKLFNKITVPIYIIVALLVVFLYQAFTTIALCNTVLPKDSLAKSVVSDSVIKGELSSEEGKAWLRNSSEDDYIEKPDGHKLHSLRIDNKSSSHSYIIICHPVVSTSEDMADYAYHFYDLGFNVILPDLRGCGESDYDTISFGVGEAEDIILWINKITEEDPDSSIFLFGLGSGGAAVLSICDEELPENVKGIIEDSGYDTLKGVFKENIESFYDKKSFPSLLIADKYVESKYGWSINDVCFRDEVHNSTVPILFIHGGEDTVVPVSQSNDMYEVCPAVGTDHLLISGADHCMAMQTNTEKYWRTVDEFIVGQLEA